MKIEEQFGSGKVNRAVTTSPALLGADTAFIRHKASQQPPFQTNYLSAAFAGTSFGLPSATNVQRRQTRSEAAGGGISGPGGDRQLVRAASQYSFNNHKHDRSKTANPHLTSSQTVIDVAAKPALPLAPPHNPQRTDQKIPPLRAALAAETMSEANASLDITSVPATKSLVKLYEEKQSTNLNSTPVESIRYVKRTPPTTIASPQPLRPIPRPKPSASLLAATNSDNLYQNREDRSVDTKLEPSLGATIAAARSAGTGQESSEGKALIPRKAPLPPPPRRSLKTLDGTTEHGAIKQIQASSPRPQPAKAKIPSQPPPRRQSLTHTGSSPTSHPQAIIPTPSPSELSRPVLPPRTSSAAPTAPKPIPTPQRPYSNSQSHQPHRLSIDSLANAMVASSLASSRHPSPAKTQPPYPPPPRRHPSTRSLFHLPHHHHNSALSGSATSLPLSRTPSPQKPFRTTMRKAIESDPEDMGGAPSKGHRGRMRHPNKHHEGDRKRYRMQLTERERKRYEGVWAANRGLLLPPTYDGEGKVVVNGDVCDVVVRDIWQRSRLGDEVLEEIWDLVDKREENVLGREEFVVGMWLCDWRLKGRKLPQKVPESVWSSVRRLTGIKVRER